MGKNKSKESLDVESGLVSVDPSSRKPSDNGSDSNDTSSKESTGSGSSDSTVGSDKLLLEATETKTVPTKKFDKPRNMHKLTYILTAISVVLCIVCVILAVLILDDSQKSRSASENKQQALDLCVPCQYLVQDPSKPYAPDTLLDKLNKRPDGKIQMCCANNANQLSVLLEATLREQKTKPVPEPPSSENDGAVLKFIPVSAHKLLREPKRISNKTGPVFNDSIHIIARLNTEFDDPVIEHARGVTVNETGLTIEHTGYYYVYASAHFRTSSTKLGSDIPKKWWRIYIHRTRPNAPAHTGSLLQIDHTVPGTKILSNTGHTGYAGGVFHLKKGDILQVCISGQGLVEFRVPSTFLGLSMLASGPEKQLQSASNS